MSSVLLSPTALQEIEKLHNMPRETAGEVGVVLETVEVFITTTVMMKVAVMMVTGDCGWVGDGGSGCVCDNDRGRGW